MQKAFLKTACTLWFCLNIYLSLGASNPNAYFHYTSVQKDTLPTPREWDGSRTGSETAIFTFVILGRSSEFTSRRSDRTFPDWVRCYSFRPTASQTNSGAQQHPHKFLQYAIWVSVPQSISFLKAKLISVLPGEYSTWHIIEINLIF